jgi:hypothetical protein
MHTVCLEK